MKEVTGVMQTGDMIQKITIKNLGTIDNMSFDKFQNMNLIIGENGTGKTFLLKALYTAMKTVEDYRRGDDVRSSADILAERLRWCFQTEKLGDIVKKGTDEPLVFIQYYFEIPCFAEGYYWRQGRL